MDCRNPIRKGLADAAYFHDMQDFTCIRFRFDYTGAAQNSDKEYSSARRKSKSVVKIIDIFPVQTSRLLSLTCLKNT